MDVESHFVESVKKCFVSTSLGSSLTETFWQNKNQKFSKIGLFRKIENLKKIGIFRTWYLLLQKVRFKKSNKN